MLAEMVENCTTATDVLKMNKVFAMRYELWASTKAEAHGSYLIAKTQFS